MIDKDSLEIGTIIYHKGRDQKGIYDESCFALETMNPDTTSLFVTFKGETLEVDLKMCQIEEFKPNKICQHCFKPLSESEHNLCTICAMKLKNKLGGRGLL